MSAYVVLDIEITDPEGFARYKGMATGTIGLYGGRYLARGGATEILEGDWNPGRVVILEFDSIARAREWLESPEYRDARRLRHQAARTNMIVVEGV
jgi:uncharacterized protein (DUF1330 family)